MKLKNKYLKQRFFFFISGIFYSICYSFFFTKRTKTIIFNSACNSEFTWNAKSFFIHAKKQLQEQGFSVYFVINNKDKRELLKLKYGDYFISNDSFSEKHKIYRSAVWILSTLETPCSGIFLNRNRFVFHLGHGTPIKNIGLCENDLGLIKKIFYKINASNISYFLSTSSYFLEYMTKAFGVSENKIIVSPQPRIVDLFSAVSDTFKVEKDKKYIIYAPTWRHYDSIKLFPFIKDLSSINILNDKLKKIGVVILLRLHPRFESNIDDYLSSNIINFNSSLCEDVSEVLNQTDGLITDYSSIYCDYLLLNKPVALLPYDLERYKEEIGFSHNYEDIFPNTIITTEEDFLVFCESVALNTFDIDQQVDLKTKLNYIPEELSVIDFNISIVTKEVSKRWPGLL